VAVATANLFASSVLATPTVAATAANASSSLFTAGLSSANKVNPNEIKCEICEDGAEEDATVFCVVCHVFLRWVPEGAQEAPSHC